MGNSYDITIRQGSNVVRMYAGECLEDAQTLMIQIAAGLDEHSDPWSCTIEVMQDDL